MNKALRKAFIALGLCISPALIASPYIEVGDNHLRNSLQLLADGGFMHGPINTFPLSWAPVVRDMLHLDPSLLNAAQYEAYIRIMAALEFSTQSSYKALKVEARSGKEKLNDYSSAMQENASASYSHEIQGDHVAVRLTTQLRHDAEGGDDYTFDGSYIAATIGNWGLSYDQLDMWWGPGEDQALLHSNNARPVQALRITRLGNEAFELPILSALGYWTSTAYIGRSESAGNLGHHQVAGARFTISPVRGLELGASYTGQWGGNDGLNVSTSKNISDFITFQRNSAVRNQYASVDFRYSPFGYGGVYGEYMQSQRSSSPSAHLLGVDFRFARKGALSNVFVEMTRIDVIYDDAVDLAGYRRWGRTVGAAVDQDANGFVFGYNRYLSSGKGFELRARVFDLGNHNNLVRQSYDNVKAGLAPDEFEVSRVYVSFTYQHPLANSLIRLGVESWSDSVENTNTFPGINPESETNLYASWEYRW